MSNLKNFNSIKGRDVIKCKIITFGLSLFKRIRRGTNEIQKIIKYEILLPKKPFLGKNLK